MSIIYKVCEFTGDFAIVTGWSLSTEVLGFLDSYVVSRHLLKQVSAGNLVAGPVLALCLGHEAPQGKCSGEEYSGTSNYLIVFAFLS